MCELKRDIELFEIHSPSYLLYATITIVPKCQSAFSLLHQNDDDLSRLIS
jgi:hypothetical protein